MNTYSLNQPMDWETFKSLPIDIQQSYIDILQRRFNVTAATISKELFGNTAPVLRLHMDKHGIKYTAMKGRGMTADEREIWERWLNPEKCEPAHEPEEGEPEMVQHPDELFDPKPVAEEEHTVEEVMNGFKEWSEFLPMSKPLSLDELTAVFTGVFSPENFLDWVSRLPIPYDNVRIKVEVTRK